MNQVRNWSFLVLLIGLLFASCEKEPLTPTTPINTPTTAPEVEIGTHTAANNTATSLRALAAAARTSHSNNENFQDSLDNSCGCYDVFNEIDFDGTPAEIEAAVEAILEALTAAEEQRLFEPVCTDDGNIYESACIADCEGITNYHVCSDDELDDYFFGGVECGGLEDLTFPFEVDLPDGTAVTVNNEEELFAVLEQWFEVEGEWDDDDWNDDDKDGDWEECFTVIYPVQVVFPDGSTQTFNSDEEIENAIDVWYNANPESKEDPMPVYPVQIILADSTLVTIENEEQFDKVDIDCYGDYDDYEDYDDFDELCFDLVFPVTVNNPDSTTILANNEAELEDALEVIFGDVDHIDEEAIFAAVLPFDIILKNGTTQTINSLEDLTTAVFACFGGLQQNDNVSAKSLFTTVPTKKSSFLQKIKE